ncbi:MAG: hypothetical protein R3F59_04290 [Myxococcota bacterium]
MRGYRWVALLAAAGCEGELEPIPVYDEGVVSEGDCDLSEIETFDAEIRVPVYGNEDPYLILPGEYGKVIRNESDYIKFMSDVNFASFPLVDFDRYNVAATWITIQNGCGFDIEERHLNRKKDGSLVFDVLFFDGALGCDQVCGERHYGLVVDAINKSEQVSICRRIRPGCAN